MADVNYIDGFQYTGKQKDESGTSKVSKIDIEFCDSTARKSAEEIQKSVQELDNKTEENKTVQLALTISVSDWQGDEAPFSYDFGEQYQGKNLLVGFNNDEGTDGQLLAFQSAVLVGGSGTKMYATGEKPVVDIPVIVQIS